MSYISVANFGTSIPCDQVVQGLRASYQSPMQAFLAILSSFYVLSSNSTSKGGGCLKDNRLGVGNDLIWSLKDN